MRDDNFLTEMNARHLWHPMAHPGEMRAAPPKVITGAEGVRITDLDGHTTIDAVGGLWNVNLGYSCAPIKAAIADQLQRLPYYSAFKGTTNDAAIELSVKLAEMFGPEGMTRAFFTAGGSDSVDTALKLARQYHRLRGEPGRTKFIAIRKGYHGTHWGGASVNGNPQFRAPYEPMLPGCFHIPAPYAYRNPFDESDPERLAALCLRALEAEIEMQVPGTVAAFIMEPVLGAGGVIPPHPSFMPGAREICDRHGVLLIADEVITGFGRTGDVSGSRHWGVKPDMMCLAKAITSGYFPMGAVLANDRMAEVFEGEQGAMIGTGYTYSGHPVGCAAALACLAETERLALWDRARHQGARLKAGLTDLAGRHDIIGDVRGEGMMCAVEIVSDRAAKSADAALAGRVFEATYEAGVMVRWSGHNLVMSPPLILSDGDCDRIVAALDEGLAAA
ncbi:aminotransferase class III-fold pyridoxal phosphate-dependent enzyme [Jannaschia sp. S6380]|uniref:aminotransferase class III-fold pyridoxal phosphate-dependent enzyme n=1 Tax=Jannaschia sp. S6380 TaxID=2926408 RepID=UPI001FF65240|nr:aminotransferase class III-fold pyridoxal phosphate-dependent enzyme [Jannaschia sp. S6380]MCK0167999.1 aminotransferase class III-fold pyridoxal phosphate-dependent enzyme [Jannaschia sp. S6380]